MKRTAWLKCIKAASGESATVDTMRERLLATFFDPKRYDLARVGRYKFNKKLSLAGRIENQTAAESIVNPETGEIMLEEGGFITPALAVDIQNAGVKPFCCAPIIRMKRASPLRDCKR